MAASGVAQRQKTCRPATETVTHVLIIKCNPCPVRAPQGRGRVVSRIGDSYLRTQKLGRSRPAATCIQTPNSRPARALRTSTGNGSASRVGSRNLGQTRVRVTSASPTVSATDQATCIRTHGRNPPADRPPSGPRGRSRNYAGDRSQDGSLGGSEVYDSISLTRPPGRPRLKTSSRGLNR